MSAARAVLRGFRVSWKELTRRPRPVAAPTERVAAFRCWTVLRVPHAVGGDLAETLRRR